MTLKNSGKEQQSVCTEPKKKCSWLLVLTSGYLPASEELWKSYVTGRAENCIKRVGEL